MGIVSVVAVWVVTLFLAYKWGTVSGWSEGWDEASKILGPIFKSEGWIDGYREATVTLTGVDPRENKS